MNFRHVGISAIIRTKNSSRTLSECLKSLNSQSCKIDEVIIVDSGSEDETIEIAKNFNCKIILYPADSEFNYSKALNLGINAASESHILIVSSHVQLKCQNTIETMLSFLNTWERIVSVSIKRDAIPDDSNYIVDGKNVIWRIVNRNSFKADGMYNFCSLIRKENWRAYNFNENLPRCEDQDWAAHFYKLYNACSAIIYYPTVYYDNPYYNVRKDAWDYITLGRYIDGYFISKKFVRKLLLESLLYLFQFKLNQSIHNVRISYYIIKDRCFGTQVHSVYHKNL